MTKKKASRSKQKSNSAVDTSEEELKEINFKGKVCQHVQRAVNFSRVKRNLKSVNISVCSNCTDVSDEEIPEVWLCLQCGNVGCGRMSTHKHAVQHYKTIHSDCHAVVLSSLSGVVWCYDCDDEVNVQQSRNLRQAVEFLLKMRGNKNVLGVKKSSTSNQQSLLETVLREQAAAKNVESKAITSKNVNKSKKDSDSGKLLFTKGLRNLGNTCFFNAVMQNLNQTILLHNMLEKTCAPDYVWEIPKLDVTDGMAIDDPNNETLKIVIPRQFPLANSLLNFYKQMNVPTSVKSEIVNPSSLFSEISKKAPQFKHFQEQDSHELLRQLLDGIRQDEVKRQKKAILRHFDVSNLTHEEIDDDTKKLIKAYSCYASHTLVEKIFGGLFISTVLCEECKMSSQVFEPFMDMSLPLFEEKPLRNRKTEPEENEYVLSKPKRESGKPSKYQERKLKQLARKEKKKKSGKGRKLSEGNEIASQSVDENLKDGSESETNAADRSDEDVENENEEIVHTSDVELQDNVAQSLDTGDVETTDYSAQVNGQNNETETGEMAAVSNENYVNKQQNSKSINISNGLEEISLNSTSDLKFADESPERTSPCDVLGLEESVPMENVSENLPKCNGDIVPSDDKNMELQAETENSNPETVTPDDHSIDALTKDFEKIHLNATDLMNPDEKMQMLRMQIKEVRIRCDSDRQGSILDSSLSPDDETNFTSCDSREDSNDSEENWSHGLSEIQTKEWILKSLLTLKPRSSIPPNECSIDSCLSYFTKPELLTGSNKFRCEKCTELKVQKTGNKKDVAYSNASKQLLVFSPPAILTLHLKRFQQVGLSLRKVNRFVEFPLILDLAPYCSSACQILPHVSSEGDEILYSLYGVVEHSGRLSSGHYTAYIKSAKRTLNQKFMCHLPLAQCDLEQLLQKFSKIELMNPSGSVSSPEECRWFYVSDSHVREVDVNQVLRCQAYLLFYERIK